GPGQARGVGAPARRPDQGAPARWHPPSASPRTTAGSVAGAPEPRIDPAAPPVSGGAAAWGSAPTADTARRMGSTAAQQKAAPPFQSATDPYQGTFPTCRGAARMCRPP